MDAADYSRIQFFHRDAVNAVFVDGAYSRRHFYGANFAAAAQSARLASESSYRSSIRESAIRQPPELLLEMERPGYNGVQRGRHLKVKYLRGGGRGRGKRERAAGAEISWEISRHFEPSLISLVDRRLHPINASSYNAARSILPNWLRLAQLNRNQLIGSVMDIEGYRGNVVRAATKMVRFLVQWRTLEFCASFC